jgi:predicted RNA-binding Zn-ribbon protein involved in translation (DUF1610 family)
MSGEKEVQCRTCFTIMIWNHLLKTYKCPNCGRQVLEESIKKGNYSKEHVLVKSDKKTCKI